MSVSIKVPTKLQKRGCHQEINSPKSLRWSRAASECQVIWAICFKWSKEVILLWRQKSLRFRKRRNWTSLCPAHPRLTNQSSTMTNDTRHSWHWLTATRVKINQPSCMKNGDRIRTYLHLRKTLTRLKTTGILTTLRTRPISENWQIRWFATKCSRVGLILVHWKSTFKWCQTNQFTTKTE